MNNMRQYEVIMSDGSIISAPGYPVIIPGAEHIDLFVCKLPLSKSWITANALNKGRIGVSHSTKQQAIDSLMLLLKLSGVVPNEPKRSRGGQPGHKNRLGQSNPNGGAKKTVDGETTIQVRLSAQLKQHCKAQGNASSYVRGLIEADRKPQDLTSDGI